jgi:hypothetical protein
MRSEPGMAAPASVLGSWMAAAVAVPLALVLAAAGQGLGALAGGCSWIGLSLPLDRPVWALVNQPQLNFAAGAGATGYWLGSWLLPMLAACAALGLRPRSRSLLVELLCLQIAWAAVSVAGSWLPLLDAADGHLARWLALQRLPAALLWAAPAAAALAGALPAIRLLALARRRRSDIGRLGRVALVVAHLAVPSGAWAGLAWLARRELPLSALGGLALPLAVALGLAWLRYPPVHVGRLERPTLGGFAAVAVAIAVAAAALWFGGRPLPGGRAAGLLWARPGDFNNIRPWVEPQPLRLPARPSPDPA